MYSDNATADFPYSAIGWSPSDASFRLRFLQDESLFLIASHNRFPLEDPQRDRVAGFLMALDGTFSSPYTKPTPQCSLAPTCSWWKR